MKKTIIALASMLLAAIITNAAPPYYATTLLQRTLAGVWANSGDTLSFTLTGTNGAGTGTNSAPLFIDVNEGTIFTTPSFASNTPAWTISGTLIPVSTNLQVTIQFTSGDLSNSLAGASFVLTNFNWSSNTFYLWSACDLCGSLVLVNSSFASPNIPVSDPYGAALNATNGYPWQTGRSNTWSLAAATNGMNSGDFRGPINSNGLAWVNVFMSNGVVRFKQVAP